MGNDLFKSWLVVSSLYSVGNFIIQLTDSYFFRGVARNHQPDKQLCGKSYSYGSINQWVSVETGEITGDFYGFFFIDSHKPITIVWFIWVISIVILNGLYGYFHLYGLYGYKPIYIAYAFHSPTSTHSTSKSSRRLRIAPATSRRRDGYVI